MSAWTLIIAALGIGMFALILFEHVRMSRAMFRPPIPPKKHAQYPSLTVIRPIRGLDVGCEENTKALLEQDYPGDLQVLFVFDSVDDEGLPVVAEIVKRQSEGKAQVLIAGTPPAHRTGKLNAMMVGLQHARGELISFNDSDSRPTPDLLRLLADELIGKPEVGCTFTPVVTYRAPQTLGEAGYTLLVNAWYGPSVTLAGGPKQELPFIMGELMLFTRQAIKAMGGLECAEGQLVDDMYLGQCIAKAGLKNVMVRWPLPLVTGKIDVAEFLKLFRRWIACSTSGLPASFVRANWMRGIESGGAFALTLAALITGQYVAALFPLAALALFTWSQLSLHEQFSGQKVPLRLFWAPAVLPLVGGVVMASTRLNPKIDWRGRSYDLNGDAKLLVPAPAASTTAP